MDKQIPIRFGLKSRIPHIIFVCFKESPTRSDETPSKPVEYRQKHPVIALNASGTPKISAYQA
jgi:hypothetical protein